MCRRILRQIDSSTGKTYTPQTARVDAIHVCKATIVFKAFDDCKRVRAAIDRIMRYRRYEPIRPYVHGCHTLQQILSAGSDAAMDHT